MRRPLTKLLLAVAAAASVAPGAHDFSVVALDHTRPARVLAAMLETDEGQSLATESIAAQVHRVAPGRTERAPVPGLLSRSPRGRRPETP
ncbi:MAG: hypothetical protein ABIR34_02180 [Marmoricola sp.]